VLCAICGRFFLTRIPQIPQISVVETIICVFRAICGRFFLAQISQISVVETIICVFCEICGRFYFAHIPQISVVEIRFIRVIPVRLVSLMGCEKHKCGEKHRFLSESY